ncbi:uncharacterized protein TNCV_4421821 [Trichonephila clavipes]|nr:uncharacterized protein TNCV_4421821 [Trichonephila clavipes]
MLDSETVTHIGVLQGEEWYIPRDLGKQCDIFYASKEKSYDGPARTKWNDSEKRSFNGSWDDFLENIDHNLAYYEIPALLACAYLKGHFKGRALDWFEVLGYRVIEDKATDYAHLNKALSEQFPVVTNRQENWRENGNNARYANNSRPQGEFNRFENQGFANNRRFEGRSQGGQSDQRFHNQSGRQSGSRNSSFRRQNERSRHLNF